MSCYGLDRLIADHAVLAPLIGNHEPCSARLDRAIELAEQALWQHGFNAAALPLYQQLFREREAWLASQGDDPRHHFTLIIPIADRPRHLQACLDSLLELCRLYGYGGMRDGRYAKLSVLIADDSAAPQSCRAHQRIAEQFSALGLSCHYFSQQEQWQELERLSAEQRQQLQAIIGALRPEAMGHKGASSMRNLCYLRLARQRDPTQHQLFYFIDSDQEFRQRIADCDEEPYAINYLHQLDRLFSDARLRIVTGKVVGDPPVSPAVMAGNLLLDLHAFFDKLGQHPAESACSFHRSAQSADDASYHDMANLFGFARVEQSFHYPCSVEGEHDQRASLRDFAERLGRFFDGEHPTRKSDYRHLPLSESLQPARTIYTGNYCFQPEALDAFIPFAGLRLRMAGPVLGRLLKAECGDAFCSANLPMLHRRTLEELGQSEFRPGIERDQQQVDLSGEFERQFFGDLMLFSMERLTAAGYPQQPVAEPRVVAILAEVEAELRQRYDAKQAEIQQRLAQLQQQFEAPEKWWQQDASLADARHAIAHFIANMAHNFGPQAEGYRQIRDSQHAGERKAQMLSALLDYPQQRHHWQQILFPHSHETRR